MAERTVFVRVGARVDGAVAGIKKVRASIDDLTKADLKSPQKAFDGISSRAALMGAGVAFGIAKGVQAFADFDAAVSAASAALPEAGDRMEDLRQLAVDLGKDTSFSATEAAQGITEMAKAGVGAEDILGGGLKGALDLAAAGQLDVARASEIAATALNQFKLDGTDVAHVADLYAAAAGKAQGSVEDIAQAMKFAGVTAASMGISIEETTGTLGLFASKGIIGEQAGTSFRSMLLSLTAPSKLAKKTLDEYNISLFDASGNFIGMQGAAEQLQQKLGPLDQATRTAALGQIFGNESITAAIALYESGGEGVADWTAKVNDAGFASEQAAKLTDNLKGDLERLGGTIETTFIESGSSANGAARALTQGLEGVVETVGRIPGPVLLAGTAIGGLALVLPKGISVARDFADSMDTLGVSFDKVSKKAPRTARALQAIGAVGAVIGGLTTAGAGLEGMWLDASGANDDATKSLQAYISKGKDAEDVTYLMQVGFGDLGGAIEHVFGTGGLKNNVIGFFDEVGTGFGIFGADTLTEATQFFEQVDAGLSGLVQSGNAEAAAQVFQQIAAKAQLQGISLEQVKEKLPGYTTAVAAAGDASADAAPKIGEVSPEVQGIKDAAEDAATKLDDLRTKIEAFGSPLLEQRADQRAYADAVRGAKESLQEQIDALVEQRLEAQKIENPTKKQAAAATAWAKAQIAAGKGLDATTEAGARNSSALDMIAQKAFLAASSTFALTKDSKLAAAEVAKGRKDFIDMATQMGLNATQASLLADNLGLIPKDVETTIGLSGVETTQAQLDATTGKVTTLDKSKAEPAVKAKVDSASFSQAEHKLDVLARNRYATVTVRLRDYTTGYGLSGSNIRVNAATGGAVMGPGTGTSDSIPAMLSNGEHVLTAAEVAAAGGHGEIFKLRKAILTHGIAMRAIGGPSSSGFSAPMSSFRAAPVAAASGPSMADLAKAIQAAGPTTIQVYGANLDERALAATVDWQKARAR